MPKNLSQIIQQIPSLVPNYCDKCGAKHANGDFEIISQDNEKALCKLNCYSCGNSYIINVTLPGDHNEHLSARRAPFISDLNMEEIRKFSNVEKIDNEEILDVFMAINEVKNFNDLKTLLNGRKDD